MNLFLQLLILQSLPLWYIFQVTGFVAALRMFFTYGLESRTQITYPAPGNQEKELHIMSKSSFDEPKKVEHSPYRPPHLRKKDTSYMRQKKSQSSSDHESSTVDFTSSDSDYSDSDGSVKESETVWHSKVRVAAIVCIQVSSQILNSPHDAWVIQGVLFFFFFLSLNQMAIVAYKNQWNPPLILLVEPTCKPPPSGREQGIVLGITHVNRSLRWSLHLGWHMRVIFSDARFCYKYIVFLR